MCNVQYALYYYSAWSTLLYVLAGPSFVNSLPSPDYDPKPVRTSADVSQLPATSRACVFSFYSLNTTLSTNSSDSAVVDPGIRSGGPLTIPCEKFPAEAVQHKETARPTLFSRSGANYSIHNETMIATTSDAFRPTFIDTRLTGCFAGTGGSTTYTIHSGYYRPNTRNKAITTMATKDEVVSIMCSDFMHLPFAPYSILQSFVRSPICTSYAEWYIKKSTIEYDDGNGAPPGVFNKKGVHRWNCCGECAFVLPAVSILYFPTASYSGCSAITSPPASKAGFSSEEKPRHQFAVVDGATLTFPSLYMAVKGTVSVTDRCGMFGQPHTNPTIAIAPGGLVSLSFSGGLYFDPASGFRTVPYDPGLPKSCNTTDYGRSKSIYMSTAEDGETIELTTTRLTPRPPHSPVLSPPSELFDFDPAWRLCKTWDTEGSDWAFTYGAFDPPRVLQAVDDTTTTMLAATTPIISDIDIKASASPGAKTYPDQPQMTGVVATAEKPRYSESSVMGNSETRPSVAGSPSLLVGVHASASGLVKPAPDVYSSSVETGAPYSEPMPSNSPYRSFSGQSTFEHIPPSANYDTEHGSSLSPLNSNSMLSQNANSQHHQDASILGSVKPSPIDDTTPPTLRINAQSHSPYKTKGTPKAQTPSKTQESESRSEDIAMPPPTTGSLKLVTAGAAPTGRPAVGSLVFKPFNDGNPMPFRLSAPNPSTAEAPRSDVASDLTTGNSKHRLTLDVASLLTADKSIASITGEIEIRLSGLPVSSGLSGDIVIDLPSKTLNETMSSTGSSNSGLASTKTVKSFDSFTLAFTSSSSRVHVADTNSISSDATTRLGNLTSATSTATTSSAASASRWDLVSHLQRILGVVLSISVTLLIDL